MTSLNVVILDVLLRLVGLNGAIENKISIETGSQMDLDA